MLKELRCDQFIQSRINFEPGLNVILGDMHSTNSIGKSTILMILDFVFGGDTYIEKNSGAIREVGHHTFNFEFVFGGVKHNFSRKTENPGEVCVTDKKYNALSEISIYEYRKFLKNSYSIPGERISFREAVNVYSRIWGKDNFKVDKPLRSVAVQKESDAIKTLIKLFNSYSEIAQVEISIRDQEERKKVIADVHRKNFVERLTKTGYKQNQLQLELIDTEVVDIKENLLEYTLNVEELVDKEVIELKTEKSRLLKTIGNLKNKIGRIELNLGEKRVKSRYLKKLSTFFENPNEEKIEEIEAFHSKIGSILERELKSAQKTLQLEVDGLQEKVDLIDLRIAILLKDVNSPKYIVDRIYDLTIEANRIRSVNRFYEEKAEVVEKLDELKEGIEEKLSTILKWIETEINQELVLFNQEIHNELKKVPSIHLNRSSYHYDHSLNTGTGKSYSDLIEFDLSILKLTSLPFLIHDSVLFKNIEDITMDRIVAQYEQVTKQVFIAIDGISTFSSSTQNALNNNCRLSLSEGRMLFDKDWR